MLFSLIDNLCTMHVFIFMRINDDDGDDEVTSLAVA